LVKQDNKYVGIITQRDLQKLMSDTIRALLIM
jgi:predicted transcriptional regulator